MVVSAYSSAYSPWASSVSSTASSLTQEQLEKYYADMQASLTSLGFGKLGQPTITTTLRAPTDGKPVTKPTPKVKPPTPLATRLKELGIKI